MSQDAKGHNLRNQEQPGLWDTNAEPRQGEGRTPRPVSKVPEQVPSPLPGTPPLLPAYRPAKPMEHRELWDITEVANYLGVPKQTIYSWRTTGYGPKGFRVGKHVRWRAATVIEWTLGLEQGR